MTHPKHLIIFFIGLLSSCGNNPRDITEANNYYTKNPDSLKKEIQKMQFDSALFSIWTEFQQAVSDKDINTFRQLSLDSLQCCDTTYSTSKFISKCFDEVFETSLVKKLRIPKETNQIDKTMELNYFSNHVLKNVDYNDHTITLKQFQIVKEFTLDGAWTMTFDFIKTKQGYKFYGCYSYGGPICCR